MLLRSILLTFICFFSAIAGELCSPEKSQQLKQLGLSIDCHNDATFDQMKMAISGCYPMDGKVLHNPICLKTKRDQLIQLAKTVYNTTWSSIHPDSRMSIWEQCYQSDEWKLLFRCLATEAKNKNLSSAAKEFSNLEDLIRQIQYNAYLDLNARDEIMNPAARPEHYSQKIHKGLDSVKSELPYPNSSVSYEKQLQIIPQMLSDELRNIFDWTGGETAHRSDLYLMALPDHSGNKKLESIGFESCLTTGSVFPKQLDPYSDIFLTIDENLEEINYSNFDKILNHYNNTVPAIDLSMCFTKIGDDFESQIRQFNFNEDTKKKLKNQLWYKINLALELNKKRTPLPMVIPGESYSQGKVGLIFPFIAKDKRPSTIHCEQDVSYHHYLSKDYLDYLDRKLAEGMFLPDNCKELLSQSISQSLQDYWPDEKQCEVDKDNCKYIKEVYQNVIGRLMQIGAINQDIFSTPNQEELINCDIITSDEITKFVSNMHNVLKDINSYQNCQPLKTGETKIIYSPPNGTSSSPYALVRGEQSSPNNANAGEWTAFINLELQPDDSMKGNKKEKIKKVYENVQSCLDQYPILGVGSEGQVLKLAIKKPKGLSKMPPSQRVKISDGKLTRNNSLHWGEEINCATILHELSHGLGLVDMYDEKHNGRNDNHEYVERHAKNVDYNCRIPGPTAHLMNQHTKAKERVDNSQDTHLLSSADIDFITFPFCESKSHLYRQCIQGAYITSFSNLGIQSCPDIPIECYEHMKNLKLD